VTKVILYIAASLDGFIARRDGDISWLDKYQVGSEDYGYADFYHAIGACIMGAKTYEKALTLTGGIDNKMPTYVVTNRQLPVPPGADIIFYSGDLPGLLGVIKKKTRKNIWLVGGGQLADSFLTEGLIDDIILSTIPIILGEGISLFGKKESEIDLDLVKVVSYSSGIVQTHYTVRHIKSPK
jgi:dihydrofolate reductase